LKLKQPVFRIVLSVLLTFSVVPAVSAPALPTAPVATENRQYRLRLFQIHTGEKLGIVHKDGSSYVPAALAELDDFLRDYRNGEIRHYDPRLFDLLYELLNAAGRPEAWINVVCGYRNPQTNTYLRDMAMLWQSTVSTCWRWRLTFGCPEPALPSFGTSPYAYTKVESGIVLAPISSMWM
jgi:Bacterial protein of unknown function (DUF882)